MKISNLWHTNLNTIQSYCNDRIILESDFFCVCAFLSASRFLIYRIYLATGQ